MRTQKKSYKMQDKLFFCKLCEYVAESEEDLNMHYELVHDDGADLIYILAKKMEEEMEKRPKLRTFKEKAIQQLLLMINGVTFRNEYIGSCTTTYYIGRLGNAIILLPYATIC